MKARPLLLLPLFVSLLTAQAPKSARISGRVLDTAGEPVAGATVCCMHRALPGDLQSDDVDRREFRCDASGVFRGELLAGRDYSVWASWANGATAIAEGVADGGFVELRGAPDTGPVQIPLRGLPAWNELAPLSFRTVVGSVNLDLVEVPLRDDTLLLPSLPPMEVRNVEVLDRAGRLLWAFSAHAAAERELPPLADVRMEVLDAAGAPIAGATIQRHLRNYWFTQSSTIQFGLRFRNLWPTLGVTDDEGVLLARVPTPSSGLGAMFTLASKPGHGTRIGVPHGDADAVMRFELPAIDELGLQLHVGGQPYSGPIASVWRVKNERGTGMPFSPPLLHCVSGRIVRPALPSNATIEQAWVLLPDALRSELQTTVGAAPPRAFSLPDAKAALLGGVDALDPQACRAVCVVTAAGTPAMGATVLAASIGSRYGVQEHFAARADRLGRVLVPNLGAWADARHLLVAAVTPQGWGVWRGEVATLPADAAISLQLAARPELTGVLRDADGKPVGDAEVHVRVQLVAGTQLGEQEFPTNLVSSLLAREGTVRTDAAGRFRRALLPFTGDVNLRAHVGTALATLSVACEPGEPPPSVEMRLAAPAERAR